jgi:heme iron utilization protein
MPPTDERFRTFDDASLVTLAALVRDHRQAVLATLDERGHPYTAMVAYTPEPDFGAVLLHLADLAAHKRHLRADPRVSLLLFQPDNGRTEILQHQRLSLTCRAAIVPKDGPAFSAAREVYLGRFPQHKMMFELGDFDLVRLTVDHGLLNAGFGRAFPVTPADLAAASRVAADPAAKA